MTAAFPFHLTFSACALDGATAHLLLCVDVGTRWRSRASGLFSDGGSLSSGVDDLHSSWDDAGARNSAIAALVGKCTSFVDSALALHVGMAQLSSESLAAFSAASRCAWLADGLRGEGT